MSHFGISVKIFLQGIHVYIKAQLSVIQKLQPILKVIIYFQNKPNQGQGHISKYI